MSRPALSPVDATALAGDLADNALAVARILEAAQSAGESGDSSARVLRVAQGKAEVWAEKVKLVRLNWSAASGLLDELYTIQALAEGAISTDPRSSRGAVAGATVGLVKRMVESMDILTWPDGTPAEEQWFLLGKDSAANMIAEAIELKGHDTPELFACYRRPGVAQDVFVRTYVNRLAALDEPSFTAGFCAALAGTLAEAGGGNLNPHKVSGASYEECVGRPETVSRFKGNRRC